jgi:2-isopropylmalate synthase
MALRTRPTQFEAAGSGVQTEHITAASRLVSYLTGFAVQPNKAIVGGNAFAHESGIHQDGVIKHPLTYEIMTPQSVGLSGSQLTIGKLSGRRGLQGKLRELGHDLEGETLDAIYRGGDRNWADAKKEVTDADLLARRRAGARPRSRASVAPDRLEFTSRRTAAMPSQR